MIYLEQPDEMLVTLTLAGEEKAYEALVIRYQKMVLSAAYSVTGNHYMAEDAAQDAFVSAWIKLNMLREPSKFPAWVCRIAKNCAKNLVIRYRDYVSTDALKNHEWESGDSVEACVVASDEQELLRESVNSLPKKVRQVMTLHYFEGLTLAEIADKLRLPLGTVKWQLHDGREKLRKELGVMNENERDTLVQRVMKSVEELKKWRLNTSKAGFERVYADVLAEVETLPESVDKYHAMADVLMHGYWWLPGEKNDALLARIRDAAEAGRNEEVFAFVLSKEEDKLSGQEKIDFIREKQIPRLEAAGYTNALGQKWFWLGREYFRVGDTIAGYAAYEQVLNLLTPEDVYYATALAAIRIQRAIEEREQAPLILSASVSASGEEYRVIDGKLRFWSQPGYTEGRLVEGVVSIGGEVNWLASLCDCLFYDPLMKPGDVYTGTDGRSTLTFAADEVSAHTACGTFEGCELWIIQDVQFAKTVKTYYKPDVGIVRSELTQGGKTCVCTLKNYHIVGGHGRIPLAAGNRWEYTVGLSEEVYTYENVYEVTAFNGTSAVLWHTMMIWRDTWDEDCWDDQMRQMRSGYCKRLPNADECLHDVTPFMEQAKTLARTPLQIAHTRVACDVMRRILETDPTFNPKATGKGYWNFFEYLRAERDEEEWRTFDDRMYSFEWKDRVEEKGYSLLFNDVYGILQDAAEVIWSNKWHPGYQETIRYERYNRSIVTELVCEEAGTIVVAAGRFENCLRISLNIQGMTGGFAYRGTNKEYIFAPRVGIVRVTHWRGKNKGDYPPATYELAAYTGEGEGYMPFDDGLFRRYEAIGLTDGYVGAAEYTYLTDDDGSLVILANRTGIRQLATG